MKMKYIKPEDQVKVFSKNVPNYSFELYPIASFANIAKKRQGFREFLNTMNREYHLRKIKYLTMLYTWCLYKNSILEYVKY